MEDILILTAIALPSILITVLQIGFYYYGIKTFRKYLKKR